MPDPTKPKRDWIELGCSGFSVIYIAIGAIVLGYAIFHKPPPPTAEEKIETLRAVRAEAAKRARECEQTLDKMHSAIIPGDKFPGNYAVMRSACWDDWRDLGNLQGRY